MPPTSSTLRASNAKQVIRVPYMDEDVDLGGLLKINRYLFASEQERRQEMAATGAA